MNKRSASSQSHHPSDQIIGSNPEGAGGNWIGFVVFMILGGSALLWAHWEGLDVKRLEIASLSRLEEDMPEMNARSGYVNSETCLSCHPDQHDSWKKSYHRTMTQTAVGDHVLGDFSDHQVVSDGLLYQVYKKDGEFWANMPDPDEMMYIVQGGKEMPLDQIPRVDRRVVMTTGSHHYQTYWVESPRYEKLLQTLPLIYLPADQRWIPREAAFMRGPDDGGRFITQWNHHCIRCHSTGGNPGLNLETGQLETSVAELGISCEACHGPGEEHVKANQDFFRRYAQHQKTGSDPTIVNPSRLDHKRSSQVCGQCHGVFTTKEEFGMEYASKGELYKPGDDLHKTRYYIQYPTDDSPPDRWADLEKNPQFFAERWWEDGTILAGGREFTAMSASKCYTQGELSCLTCHSMHSSDPADQLLPLMRTNQACVQCHIEDKYNQNITEHTFHESASSGSQCMNCHMPHTTYALLGAIRSHQIEAPSVEKSIRYGTPNACNLCHLDQTLAWSQEAMNLWYGSPKLELTTDQTTVAASVLWLIQGHAAQRVIAAWSMGWEPAREVSGENWIPPILATLLADPYGVVRYVSEKALRSLVDYPDWDYDFLAEKDELEKQPEALRGFWSLVGSIDVKRASRVLLTESGILQRRKLYGLLRERDNRSITIKE